MTALEKVTGRVCLCICYYSFNMRSSVCVCVCVRFCRVETYVKNYIQQCRRGIMHLSVCLAILIAVVTQGANDIPAQNPNHSLEHQK